MYPIPIITPQPHDDLGRSALPDAPVVPEAVRRHPLQASRLALAATLRTAARAVEPAQRRRTPVGTGPGMSA
jgi:hypothetical protein